MKLTISDLVQQKISYLLNRFSIEWSGPAWFSRECTKKGFPSKWKLEYFPLTVAESIFTMNPKEPIENIFFDGKNVDYR